MKKLLQLNTSIFSDGGQSSQLAQRFVAAWRARNPGASVTVRDLAREPVPHLDAARFAAFIAKPEERNAEVPHLDAARFAAFIAKPEERNAEQQAATKESDALITELKAADVLVLGLPLYNFGVPSTLKAYFDHIGRAGHTFKYTEKGPVGLMTGKKAFVFATRGGLYKDTPLDTQTSYVRAFLGFIGITDVEFVYAEGLALSESRKQASIAQAQREIGYIIAPEAIAA